jgi:hypothetical protein
VQETIEEVQQRRPVANLLKLFCHNLRLYQRVALSFDPGYAARSLNYAVKVLCQLATGVNVMKPSFSLSLGTTDKKARVFGDSIKFS